MAAGCKMSHIRCGSDSFGQSRESVQHILWALIGELLALEVMIVDSEGQLFLRKSPIDSIQNAASSIACDIAAAQKPGKPHRVFQILIFFDGCRVVGHAADSCPVKFGSSRTKQFLGG